MTQSNEFWKKLDQLVATSNIKIERSKGSTHPKYASFIYPLDYGYLADTQAGDASNIDVWIGSLSHKRVTSVICSVDLEKRDTEIKILLGCTSSENQVILNIHNIGNQSAILLVRT
ncbi:inorganic pyrophosphatase [Nostoc sp. FACHB-87]|uniref:inorganic pyrophosphatase n=1 Tax=Nostocaceae TaxID=1162 RepID=UPI001682569A|nr:MULTISPECIES: inorganic pyrophosphatase [Nostocaceae]MBD2454046.1 inorganic pyrophosphatase [Nostoc sp. FACHB-87]MBD2476259.1 inorganic pyrophosphatase [Anabaena sp. FACHB-83]